MSFRTIASFISKHFTLDYNRSPSNLNAVLEMCRHKLWMYLTLSDVDICKAKEESLKKMMKEYNDIESDLKLLHNICK